MKPCLSKRRLVEVKASQTLDISLKHGVYSCPDTPEFEKQENATALILTHYGDGRRVPVEVSTIVKIGDNETTELESLARPLRRRIESYRADIAANRPFILAPGTTHRFYLLGDEPWPLWLQQLTVAPSNTEWTAILSICAEPDRYFEWPKVGTLLWPGCVRQERHHYPDDVAARLRRFGIDVPDDRSNGPAIMSFLIAGGKRPVWGNEGWPIHHIYDGSAPVPEHPVAVPHAVQDPHHFTHSGGLVAAHPVVHHLAHQSTLLKWLLRREAFLRFGYDPMGVF
jgi:hypothetical protein